MSDGYSCADMVAMIREAAMQPVRELPPDQILTIKDSKEIRKINLNDFSKAMASI